MGRENCDFEKIHLKVAELVLFLLKELHKRLILTTLWALDWYNYLLKKMKKLSTFHFGNYFASPENFTNATLQPVRDSGSQICDIFKKMLQLNV